MESLRSLHTSVLKLAAVQKMPPQEVEDRVSLATPPTSQLYNATAQAQYAVTIPFWRHYEGRYVSNLAVLDLAE